MVTPLGRLRVAAGFGFAVAKADGRIAASERRQVRAFLERRYAATRIFRQGWTACCRGGGGRPDPRRRPLAGSTDDPADAWPELYQFAVSVADAAGERNTREIECLARVAEELGIGVHAGRPPHVPAAPGRCPATAGR